MTSRKDGRSDDNDEEYFDHLHFCKHECNCDPFIRGLAVKTLACVGKKKWKFISHQDGHQRQIEQKDETVNLESHRIIRNDNSLKIYYLVKENDNENQQKLVFKEVCFAQGEKLERSITISETSALCDGKFNVNESYTHKDYLLVLFISDNTLHHKLVLFDFFLKKETLIEEKSFQSMVLNTSIYDFYFLKKSNEILNLIFPSALFENVLSGLF